MNLCWFWDRWNIVIIIILYARYIKGIFLYLDVLVRKKLKCLYKRISCIHTLYMYGMYTYIKQIFNKTKNTVSCMHVECDVHRENR